jgi:hypothetical protein
VQDLKNSISHRNRLSETMFTHVRPYISDMGPANSGPSANERKKIESIIATIEVFLVSGSNIAFGLCDTEPEQLVGMHRTIFNRKRG